MANQNDEVYMYRKEKDGTYTPLTKEQYQKESATMWSLEYQQHVLELIKKVNA
jgi:hypothetical protein